MNKKTFFTLLTAVAMSAGAAAQSAKGGIDEAMFKEISSSYNPSATEKALQNIILANPIKTRSVNQETLTELDTYFSNSVNSKGITNQESSGRCWLFTGMNVMRAKMIAEQNLDEFQFSQVYGFFFDQLEKSNLFLQSIIDTRKKPQDDRVVEWLFKNPLSDGGTFTGVADIITKYGIVPKGVMRETYTSNNTDAFNSLLQRKMSSSQRSSLLSQPQVSVIINPLFIIRFLHWYIRMHIASCNFLCKVGLQFCILSGEPSKFLRTC